MSRLKVIIFCLIAPAVAIACTSAIVSASASKSGRPLLWKNRDTSTADNFIARVDACDGEHAFVALFNAGDSLLQEAWMGMNDAGFAIMNTASYNLAPDTAEYKDQEGRVMALALKKCRSLADFEALLDSLPKPMGVQANFGAIDSFGAGAYYETDDNGYVKYSLADQSDDIIIRTNFSVSGDYVNGMGYIRYENAQHLLRQSLEECAITPATFTEGLSRSFYHSLLDKDLSLSDEQWIVDQDFIPRFTSTASVVIEGVIDPQSPAEMVMWTAMGYPPVAHVQAVTVDSIPADLLPDANWHSPECDAAAQRKAEVFPIHRGSGSRYIDLKKLKEIDAEQRAISQRNYQRR